jgi:hypothetical protein
VRENKSSNINMPIEILCFLQPLNAQFLKIYLNPHKFTFACPFLCCVFMLCTYFFTNHHLWKIESDRKFALVISALFLSFLFFSIINSFFFHTYLLLLTYLLRIAIWWVENNLRLVVRLAGWMLKIPILSCPSFSSGFKSHLISFIENCSFLCKIFKFQSN